MPGVNLAVVFAGAGLPRPEREYRFAEPRRFAFDLAWPEPYYVALEIEGGVFGKGKPCPLCNARPVAGHRSIDRFLRDMEKYNLAASMGWCIIRVLPEQLESGEAVALVENALASRGWEP